MEFIKILEGLWDINREEREKEMHPPKKRPRPSSENEQKIMNKKIMDEKELVESMNSFSKEVLGAQLSRTHFILADEAGYKSITFCFSNGKSICLKAELDIGKQRMRPVMKMIKGQWEMLEAEPEEDKVDKEHIKLPHVLPPPPNNEFLKEGDTKSREHPSSADGISKIKLQDLAEHRMKVLQEMRENEWVLLKLLQVFKTKRIRLSREWK